MFGLLQYFQSAKMLQKKITDGNALSDKKLSGLDPVFSGMAGPDNVFAE